jgi:hypothetical protein
VLPEHVDREDEHESVEAEHDQDWSVEVILKEKGKMNGEFEDEHLKFITKMCSHEKLSNQIKEVTIKEV